jgi:hypothetical protein
MGKMIWFRFFFYLLRHGSLLNKPVNFRLRQKEAIKTIVFLKPRRESAYSQLRNRLANTKIIGSLIGNLAYFKSVNQINKNYFMVPSLKIGYIRILKSASTSILKELLPLIDERLKKQILTDKQVDNLAAFYSQHNIKLYQNQYQLFTIVRNPFQRLVSVYLDLFNTNDYGFVLGTYLFGIFKPTMTFSQFVQTLILIPDKLKEPHFTGQYRTVSECGGVNRIKCFRLEKDHQQIIDFLQPLGIRFEHRNKGSDYDYRSFYSLKTANHAFNLYKHDIEIFGYEEEYKSLLLYLKE